MLDDRLLLSSVVASVPSSSFIDAHPAAKHQKVNKAKLVVSGPTSAGETAGKAFQVTIKSESSSGKTNTGDNHSVTLTSSDGQKVIASPIKLKKGKATVSVVLDTADSTTLTASEGSITGTSSSFTVHPGDAASFSLNYDIIATAGSPFSLVVTALDAHGNIATGYHGTATLTSDGQTVSPSEVSFSSSSGTPGVATVNATLDKAGDATLKATAGSVTSSGHDGIIVEPAAATSFSISAPSSETAGTGFTVTVTAHDPYGNIATGYSGTATLTSSDGETVSPSAVVFDNETGVATVAITLDKAGTTTLTATAGSVAGTSDTITVQPAAAASFSVKAPSPETAGADFTVTVTALDAYGNVVTGYHGTATLSNVPYTHFPPTVTFGSPGETPGVATATVYLYAAGDQTIKATAGSITGSSNPITVNPAALASFQVSPSSTDVTAGSGFGLTIWPLDAYGNFVTGYQGTATLTSSDGQAVSPSTVTFGASGEPQGQVSVNVTLDEPDQVTLTAAAGSVTGTSPSPSTPPHTRRRTGVGPVTPARPAPGSRPWGRPGFSPRSPARATGVPRSGSASTAGTAPPSNNVA